MLARRLRMRFGFDAFLECHLESAAACARKLSELMTGEPYNVVCYIENHGFPGARMRSRTALWQPTRAEAVAASA
jgi:hypothetical protein